MRKLSIMLFATTVAWAQSPDSAKQKGDELARVVILNFLNIDRSEEHKWVETSLPDAIHSSMKDKFEFVRTEQAKAQEIANRLPRTKKGYSLKSAGKLAKQTNSDIIIYGNFRLTKRKDRLVINATIYNATGKQVIGAVQQTSTIDQRVFKSIDIIAQGIVDHIYKFALQAEKIEKKPKEPVAEEELRLLVLVPSYKTKDQKKQAIKELEAMKRELNGRYNGRFVTIFEFYQQKNIAKKVRKRINRYARKRQQEPIIAWLGSKGVKDAFIILVTKKKVNITPVVAGIVKSRVAYEVGAKKTERKKAVAEASKKAGIITKAQAAQKKKEQKEKVELTKEIVKDKEATPAAVLLHLSGGFFQPMAKPADSLQNGIGFSFDARYGAIFGVFYPMVKFSGIYMKGTNSITEVTLGQTSAGLTYPFAMFNRRFLISPFVTGGVALGTVTSTTQEVDYVIPTAVGGLIFDYFVTASLALSLNAGGSYVFSSSEPMQTIEAGLGLAYRF